MRPPEPGVPQAEGPSPLAGSLQTRERGKTVLFQNRVPKKGSDGSVPLEQALGDTEHRQWPSRNMLNGSKQSAFAKKKMGVRKGPDHGALRP